MARQHHQLNGHESEKTPGDVEDTRACSLRQTQWNLLSNLFCVTLKSMLINARTTRHTTIFKDAHNYLSKGKDTYTSPQRLNMSK